MLTCAMLLSDSALIWSWITGSMRVGGWQIAPSYSIIYIVLNLCICQHFKVNTFDVTLKYVGKFIIPIASQVLSAWRGLIKVSKHNLRRITAHKLNSYEISCRRQFLQGTLPSTLLPQVEWMNATGWWHRSMGFDSKPFITEAQTLATNHQSTSFGIR